MAVQKHLLRMTDREASFKIYGSEGSATIDLDADLPSANQILDPVNPRKISITQMSWCGDVGVVVEVVRNSVVIATLQCDQPGTLQFGENFVDNVELGSNIVVNISRGSSTKNGQLWISLGKSGGFKAKFEPAIYGSYDNPTVSGS